jgi:hypothetical protein
MAELQLARAGPYFLCSRSELSIRFAETRQRDAERTKPWRGATKLKSAIVAPRPLAGPRASIHIGRARAWRVWPKCKRR